MRYIKLRDLEVSRIGLGAMGMSHGYTGSGTDEAGSIRTVHRALELGVTLIDTAEIYGPYTNEELLGRALKGRRDQVVLATKFGLVSHAERRPMEPRLRPGQCPYCRRGVPETAGHRSHRPVLPAPGGSEHADRGDRRRRCPRADRRGQGARVRPLGGRTTRSAAPTPSSRSPRSSRNTPCGRAGSRSASCRSCGS